MAWLRGHQTPLPLHRVDHDHQTLHQPLREPLMATKEPSLNPKDQMGRAKAPLHLWPASATLLGAMGLYEGYLKYGRANWRASDVAASVYVAAAKRHLEDWFEMGDLIHLGNALATI